MKRDSKGRYTQENPQIHDCTTCTHPYTPRRNVILEHAAGDWYYGPFGGSCGAEVYKTIDHFVFMEKRGVREEEWFLDEESGAVFLANRNNFGVHWVLYPGLNNPVPKQAPPKPFEAMVSNGWVELSPEHKKYGVFKIIRRANGCLSKSVSHNGYYFVDSGVDITHDFATPAERKRFENVKREVERKGQRFENLNFYIPPQGKMVIYAGEYRPRKSRNELVVGGRGYPTDSYQWGNDSFVILALVDDPDYKKSDTEHVAGERCTGKVMPHLIKYLLENYDHMEYTEYRTVKPDEWTDNGFGDIFKWVGDYTDNKPYWILRPVPKPEPQFKPEQWVCPTLRVPEALQILKEIDERGYYELSDGSKVKPSSLRPARLSDFRKTVNGVEVLMQYCHPDQYYVNVRAGGNSCDVMVHLTRQLAIALGVQIAPAGLTDEVKP